MAQEVPFNRPSRPIVNEPPPTDPEPERPVPTGDDDFRPQGDPLPPPDIQSRPDLHDRSGQEFGVRSPLGQMFDEPGVMPGGDVPGDGGPDGGGPVEADGINNLVNVAQLKTLDATEDGGGTPPPPPPPPPPPQRAVPIETASAAHPLDLALTEAPGAGGEGNVGFGTGAAGTGGVMLATEDEGLGNSAGAIEMAEYPEAGLADDPGIAEYDDVAGEVEPLLFEVEEDDAENQVDQSMDADVGEPVDQEEPMFDADPG